MESRENKEKWEKEEEWDERPKQDTTTTTESAFARLFISHLPPLSIVPLHPLAAASRCGAPKLCSFIFEKKNEMSY